MIHQNWETALFECWYNIPILASFLTGRLKNCFMVWFIKLNTKLMLLLSFFGGPNLEIKHVIGWLPPLVPRCKGDTNAILCFVDPINESRHPFATPHDSSIPMSNQQASVWQGRLLPKLRPHLCSLWEVQYLEQVSLHIVPEIQAFVKEFSFERERINNCKDIKLNIVYLNLQLWF